MQPTIVYSTAPLYSSHQMARVLDNAITTVDQEDMSVIVVGVRKNGEKVALRFVDTPAEYLRQMREIHGR